MFVMRVALFCVLAAALLANPAASEIAFRTRTDIDAGSAPTDFALEHGNAQRVFIADDKGLSILSRDQHGWTVPVRISDDPYVKSIAIGDLTGDGKTDVAYASREAARVSILIGESDGFAAPVRVALESVPRVVRIKPSGTNGAPTLFVIHDTGLSVVHPDGQGEFRTTTLAAPPFSADVEVVDLNGDGLTDVVIADEQQNRLTILTGTTQGGFQAARDVPTIAGPLILQAVDLGRNGGPALLVVGETGLAMHRRTGEHLGESAWVWMTPHLTSMAAADIDGDGALDVAVANRSRSTLTILRGGGDGTFRIGQSYLVGRAPQAAALVDFNRDGMLDALVLNTMSNNLTALAGIGKGLFDGAVCILADTEDLGAIATADFNRDQHLDLAVTSEQSGSVTVFVGDESGGFAARPPIRIGNQPRALVAAQLDADDAPDLAIVSFGNDAVAILTGDGQGGFEPPMLIPVGLGPRAVVTGSFGGPKHVDLAVANTLSDSVSVLYGDGRGHFPKVVTFPVTAQPSFLIVGDIDRDGSADLLVGSDASESVSTLHGNGRELGAPKTDKLEGVARPSLAEDFDGDGELDLVVLNESADAIDILPGTGPGQFGTRLGFPVGNDPSAVATGDFDGDGRIDLAVVHGSARFLSILLNRTPPRATRP